MNITWIQPYYDIILNLVPLDTESLIDVGSGYGIFGYILLKTRDIKSLTSIEPFDYDTSSYNTCHKMTWADWYKTNQDKVDVIVSTEMVEHLEKNEALLFLNQAKKKARKTIIATPYKFEEQVPYDNNRYQVHKSVLTVNDFINEGYDVKLMGVFTLKGLTARVLFHNKWLGFLKLFGVKPTNIIGVAKCS